MAYGERLHRRDQETEDDGDREARAIRMGKYISKPTDYKHKFSILMRGTFKQMR